MELTFRTIFCYNLADQAGIYFEMAILMQILLGRSGKKKRAVLLIFPFCVIFAAVGALFYINGQFAHTGGMVIYEYLQVFFWIIQVMLVYQETVWNAVATGSVVFFLEVCSDSVTGFFFIEDADLTVFSQLVYYGGINLIAKPLLICMLAAGIRFMGFGTAYQYFLYEKEDADRWKKACILLVGVLEAAVYAVNEKKLLHNSNPVLALLFLLFFLEISNYAFRCEVQKQQMEQQEWNMRQQEYYIQTLETMQQDVRLFRHDLKNMIAAVSKQAAEGDLAAVQEYFGGMARYFESLAGRQICQTTQLAHVRIPELKGLLFTKLLLMQKKKMTCSLEVIQDFEDVGMSAYDLCRVVGILLDNAVEEVEEAWDAGKKQDKQKLQDTEKKQNVQKLQDTGKKQDKQKLQDTEKKQDKQKLQDAGRIQSVEKPQIIVICTKTDEAASILVKNLVSQKDIRFGEIWKEGYSTKGSGRGTGLAGLKKIIETYRNSYVSAYLEDGWFVMEVKIRNGREIT